MAAPKYFGWISEVKKLVTAIIASTGVADAFKIIATGADGLIDMTLLPPGIGGGVINILYADLATLKTNSTLSPGSYYYIIDRFIWVRALGINKLEINGYYLAHNADYQNVSGNFIGIWNSFATYSGPLIAGSIVTIDGKMYVNNTGANGSNPAPNFLGPPDTLNWTVLAFDNAAYQLELDIIEYDFNNDWVQYRQDKRGNQYRYEKFFDTLIGNNLPETAINEFQWGNNSVSENILINARCNIINKKIVSFDLNLLQDYSVFQTTDDSVINIVFMEIESGAAVINLNMPNGGSIVFCTLKKGVQAQGNTISGNINNLICGESAQFNFNNISVSVSGLNIGDQINFENQTIDTPGFNDTYVVIKKGYSNYKAIIPYADSVIGGDGYRHYTLSNGVVICAGILLFEAAPATGFNQINQTSELINLYDLFDYKIMPLRTLDDKEVDFTLITTPLPTPGNTASNFITASNLISGSAIKSNYNDYYKLRRGFQNLLIEEIKFV